MLFRSSVVQFFLFLVLTLSLPIPAHADIFRAAGSGSATQLETLLSQGADPNERNHKGETPLHIVVSNAHQQGTEALPKATLLLKAGTDVNAKNNFGNTALLTGAMLYRLHQDLALIEILLDYDADVNTLGKGEVTPLHYAAQYSQSDLGTLLIERGAKINIPAPNHKTALDRAIWAKNTELIMFMKKHGGKIYEREGLETGKTFLHASVEREDVPTTIALLRDGEDPNITDNIGRTPLFIASKKSLPEMTKALLEFKADPNIESKRKGTPLYQAATTNCVEVVTLLIAHGAIPDKGRGSYTPLASAIHMGHKEVAWHLIQSGADVNRKSIGGALPIWLCAWKGLDDILVAIMDKGAQADAKTLGMAASGGKPSTMQIVLDQGIGINDVDATQMTPLHYAALNDKPDNCRFLVENGADLKALDFRGKTPRELARGDAKTYLEQISQ